MSKKTITVLTYHCHNLLNPWHGLISGKDSLAITWLKRKYSSKENILSHIMKK
jgi:hypothetical protein